MKKIRTVLGDIVPEQLGFTAMHDHTFVDLRVASKFMKDMFPDVTHEQLKFCPENYGFMKTGTYLMCEDLQVIDETDMDYLVKEYDYFKAIGGKSVVDPGPIGCRGSAKLLKEFSMRSGLNLICATGLYTETSRPAELLDRNEEFYYNLFKKEVVEGIDGTDVYPGILKGAVATYGANGISEAEIAVVNACARVSAETGISMHVHTDPMISGDDILDALETAVEKYGVHRDRILVCHMDNRIACNVMVSEYLEEPGVDRTLDLDIHKTLLDKGYNIGLDTWGMPVNNPNFFMPDDFERLKALITLMNLGYEKQITLGNDFSSKLASRSYGGFGCTRFADFGLTLLEQLGYEDKIPLLTVGNPARILSF